MRIIGPAILLLSIILLGNATEASCLTDFLDTYKKVKSYKTNMKKTENFPELGVSNSDNIQVTHTKGESLEYKFKTPGTTGIKNNGMVITYTGKKEIKIKPGKGKNIGGVVSFFANNFFPSEIGLYDRLAIKNELFTVDRAGFDFISHSLKSYLKKNGRKTFSETVKNGKCVISYHPVNLDNINYSLKKGTDLRAVENKFGYPAFYLFYKNLNKYSSFGSFLSPNYDGDIKIPNSFFPFELIIDLKTKLPTKFEIYNNKSTIGRYDFKDTVILKV